MGNSGPSYPEECASRLPRESRRKLSPRPWARAMTFCAGRVGRGSFEDSSIEAPLRKGESRVQFRKCREDFRTGMVSGLGNLPDRVNGPKMSPWTLDSDGLIIALLQLQGVQVTQGSRSRGDRSSPEGGGNGDSSRRKGFRQKQGLSPAFHGHLSWPS